MREPDEVYLSFSDAGSASISQKRKLKHKGIKKQEKAQPWPGSSLG